MDAAVSAPPLHSPPTDSLSIAELPALQQLSARIHAGRAAEAAANPAAEAWRAAVRAVYERRRLQVRPAYYYRRLIGRLRHVVLPGARVLDIGCGTGDMLAALEPSFGLGVDLVEHHVRRAARSHGHLEFCCTAAEALDTPDQKFDYIVLSQVLGEVYDVVALLNRLRDFAHDRTRLVIVNCSRLWQPALKLAEWLRLRPPAPPQNWLPSEEVENLLHLAGWEQVRRTGATLAPLPVPLVSDALNRYAGNLPLLQSLCLHHIHVARPAPEGELAARPPDSVSIVVPARNEAGNIDPLLERLPTLAARQEVILIEGNSTDDTWDAIKRAARRHGDRWTIRCLRQSDKGKANAVREAFAAATGELLIILDADLSVPPEELTAFRDAIAGGKAEFVNGSRMVYAMDSAAMRFLNLLGNKAFGWIFTHLLAQRFRDTLCGTKVLRRSDYERIAANRAYFGDFDPFGDFDLLFGAARLSLKIVDSPVHYRARTYGKTNISRFAHGWMLLKMCAVAARKLRFL